MMLKWGGGQRCGKRSVRHILRGAAGALEHAPALVPHTKGGLAARRPRPGRRPSCSGTTARRGAAGTYEGTLPEFAAEIATARSRTAPGPRTSRTGRRPATRPWWPMRYADMKRDAAAVVRRVAAHLGVEHVDADAIARHVV